MSDEQKKWLDENPKYSAVREFGIIALKQWADQGYLWPSGKFSLDDGQTLFWAPYRSGAIRVGRHYDVV